MFYTFFNKPAPLQAVLFMHAHELSKLAHSFDNAVALRYLGLTALSKTPVNSRAALPKLLWIVSTKQVRKYDDNCNNDKG